MMKQHRRDSIRSLIWSHIDPEKDGQLERTKIEVGDKVAKILKLIKNGNQDGQVGKPGRNSKLELVELVEDFHKQYESLYVLYDNFRRELRKKVKVHGRKEKDDSSSSFSSDSESFHSSKEASSDDGRLESEHQKLTSNTKQDLEAGYLEFADLNHGLSTTIVENEPSNSKMKAASTKTQETEQITEHLQNETEERKGEISTLTKMDKVQVSEASSRVKELENQVTGLQLELESFFTQEKALEKQVERTSAEAKQQLEEIGGLRARISELEMTSKEKGDDLSALPKKLKNDENDFSMSSTEDLTTRINNLQLGVDSIRAQKSKLKEWVLSNRDEVSTQVNDLMNWVYAMQQGLAAMHCQKFESEEQSKTTPEILTDPTQIETLKEEMLRITSAQQKLIEEKEAFIMQIKDLEGEVNALRHQKSELEEQIRHENDETDHLRDENELERTSNEGEKRIEDRDNEAYAHIMALTAKTNTLQMELDSLQNMKNQLEMQIEIEKQQNSHSLTQMENQNSELQTKIAEQQKALKEKEDTINKMSKQSKQLKSSPLQSKVNLQATERKVEDIAEHFRKNMEDNLRLIAQRIHVAEKLHYENRDFYRTTREALKEEQKELQEKIAEHSRMIAAHEAGFRKMKEVRTRASAALNGFGLVIERLDEDSTIFMNRISKISQELFSAKKWMKATNSELKQLKFDKSNLIKDVNQLEKRVGELEETVKEKDERMLGLGEEKREAIRQLCMWIDYHRTGLHSMENLSNMNSRNQKSP